MAYITSAPKGKQANANGGISRPYLAWAVQDFHLELAGLQNVGGNWIER